MLYGLKIHTKTGLKFEVRGAVTWKYFPVDGKIYYCAGRSFPAGIVEGFIEEEATV